MDLSNILFFLLALVISISFHEFFHAWLAYELGDTTARDLGRLTLNPIAHFEPIGAMMIIFMAISGWGIGWGKPVPVNPSNLRTDPRVGMGITSAAGPFSNLILAAISAIPMRLDLNLPDVAFSFLFVMVVVNVSLAIFNLIPLPPLDGFGVVQGILGTLRTRWAYEWNAKLDKLEAYGPMLLLALLAVGWFLPLNPIGWIMGGPVNAILRLLLG